MKHPVIMAACAAGLLLCGCNRQPRDVLGTPMTAETAPASPEEAAPAFVLPEGVQALDKAVLDYDQIQPVRRDLAPYGFVVDGYYTMSRDGLWGLLRSDGTEVLPCQFSAPVTACGQEEPVWHVLSDSLDQETLDALNAQLQATEDGSLETGEHDGSSHQFFYNVDSLTVQMDGGLSGGGVRDVTEEDAVYGTYLPCIRGTYVDGQGDPSYYEPEDPVSVVYANADGELLNDQVYEAGNYFYDQPLAAARQNGKWLYLDQSGAAVTDAVYDAVYGDDAGAYAAPLQNGYAAVCRDGLWGLLDSTGAEWIPCTYQGAAWDGSILWLRGEDGWHACQIPGLAAPETEDPLADLPDTITAPDRQPGAGEQTQYTTTTAGNLVLRAGPGADYDQVGTIPPGTAIQCLGLSDATPDWVLTRYDGQYGWVSTEYIS